MSKCISRHGEYSEHEFGSDPFTCDLCGACVEDEALAELDRLRAENERLTNKLELTRDTLRRRTRSHQALVIARLQCARCSTLPVEETPA